MKRMCLCFDFKGQEPSRRESCESESRVGPLTGGPQCRMSNLRNPHVPCKGLVINYREGGGYKMGKSRVGNFSQDRV